MTDFHASKTQHIGTKLNLSHFLQLFFLKEHTEGQKKHNERSKRNPVFPP